MSNWIKIVLLLGSLTLLKVSTVFGAYLIEPNLGLTKGDYSSKHDGTKLDFWGPTYGAKVGGEYAGFSGGLDLNFAHIKAEQRSPVLNSPPKTDYFGWGVGPFIGYKLPIMLRFWASYYLYTNYSATGGDRDGESLSGSGYGLGVGYQLSFIPTIDVFANLEYRRMMIKDVEDGSVNHDVKNPFNQFLLTISIPITFDMSVSF